MSIDMSISGMQARGWGALKRLLGGLPAVLCWIFQLPVAFAQPLPAVCPPTAQPPTPQQIRSYAQAARDRGFLWRISKSGRGSYLYGTVHVAKPEWIYPGPTVLNALRASDHVALELDMLDADILRRLSTGLSAPSSVRLPEALAARLKAQTERACIPAQTLSSLSLEMQAITLSIASGRVDGFDPAYAIDVFLAGLARSLGKTVVSLETPESQVELLRSDSEADTVALVEKTLAELESGRARTMVKRVADVWAGSRLQELEHYEQWCECADTEDDRRAMHRLLDERNPAMAERIAALHEQGHAVFAAVGSLHMIGPKGLPALLAQRGYRVERVDFSR